MFTSSTPTPDTHLRSSCSRKLDAGTAVHHPGLPPWSGVPHPDRPDPRAPAGGVA